MNNIPKFPDMRPAAPPGPINLPPPSGYLQRVPVFPTTDTSVKSRRVERKRLMVWFGIAVAFHAALLLGLWLMPALRIKWEPSPDAWVQVTSLPPEIRAAPAAADETTAAKPAPSHARIRRAQPSATPMAEPDKSAAP